MQHPAILCVLFGILLSLSGLSCKTPDTANEINGPAELRIPDLSGTAPAPYTGLVFWNTNENITEYQNAISLEFSYLRYDQVASGESGNWTYNWSLLDSLIAEAASRSHHLIIRFKDTDPLFTEPGVPAAARGAVRTAVYNEEIEGSSLRTVYFPDWSGDTMESFLIDFFQNLAQHYRDSAQKPAVVQVGFGLWAEYHIDHSSLASFSDPVCATLSGAMGRIFPNTDQQTRILTAVKAALADSDLLWAISIDAANSDYGPEDLFNPEAPQRFGVFDDSFLCAGGNSENWEICTNAVTGIRGGEISYYTERDQREALSANGPNGTSLATAARIRGLSYLIGDGQSAWHNPSGIAAAGKLLGYCFELRSAEFGPDYTVVVISNTGASAAHFDIYPAIKGVRSSVSLRYLQPGSEIRCVIPTGGQGIDFSLAADRVLQGRPIPYIGVQGTIATEDIDSK